MTFVSDMATRVAQLATMATGDRPTARGYGGL
jgi:hypothetical protein